MTDRELMQQALEALEEISGGYSQNLIVALRDRLAQPEQEPVANIRIWHKNGEQHAELWNWDKGIETLPDGNYDLYTSPPQRKPLTDEAEAVINAARAAMDGSTEAYDCEGGIKIESNLAASLSLCLDEYDRAIEAAHGIKGEA